MDTTNRLGLLHEFLLAALVLNIVSSILLSSNIFVCS